MAQLYFSLVTTLGRIKLAASAAGGDPVTITHFAIGDGNGAEVNPTAASTALVHEVWRTAVESVEPDPLNPAAVLVTSIIPVANGGWWMREFGIFDTDGDMIAVARPVSQYKPTAAEGQLEDIRYEFQIVIGETANVTLLVDPSILMASRSWVESRKTPINRLLQTPWLPIKSMAVTVPPAGPSAGDIYLIPAGAASVWGAQAGKLAEWTGAAWAYMSVPNGHGVCLPDGRLFVRRGGAYAEYVASSTERGLVELATTGETKAGELDTHAVTPAGLKGALDDFGGFGLSKSVTDLDLLRTTGTYFLPNAGLNGPEPVSSGCHVLVSTIGDYTAQIAADYNSAQLWNRFTYDAGANWSAWKPINADATKLIPGLIKLTSSPRDATDASSAVTPADMMSAIATFGGMTYLRVAGNTGVVVPAGAKFIEAFCVGGGGAGGASGDGSVGIAGNAGAGGSGGGYAYGRKAVVAGNTIVMTVGAAGTSNANAGGGGGGTSSVGSLMSATGGSGGPRGANTYTDSNGPGSGVGGDININGGRGGRTGPNTNTFDTSYLLNMLARGALAGGGFSVLTNSGTGSTGIGHGSGGNGASGGSGLAGGDGAPGLIGYRFTS